MTGFVGSAVRQNGSGIRAFLEGSSDVSQFGATVGENAFVLGGRRTGLRGRFFPK